VSSCDILGNSLRIKERDMLTDKTLEQVRSYLTTVDNTSKVYLGCDSSRKKEKDTGFWFATYTTVVVIHVDNSKGCKVFCKTEIKRDYDKIAGKPAMRMMAEACCVVEAYNQLEEDLLDFDVEVHLDINPNPLYGSSCAYGSAKGYVAGVTGLPVKTKPEAFAASYAADRYN
jgi:predicted RNase H-related nuclease YkuK (DUF458 family)